MSDSRTITEIFQEVSSAAETFLAVVERATKESYDLYGQADDDVRAYTDAHGDIEDGDAEGVDLMWRLEGSAWSCFGAREAGTAFHAVG